MIRRLTLAAVAALTLVSAAVSLPQWTPAGYCPARCGPPDFPFVGQLDSYSGLYAVHSAKRVLSSYFGPLYNIRRSSDNATLDVYPSANGWPRSVDVAAWLNGSTGYVTTVYDQTGNSRTISQATAINQPGLNVGGTYPVFSFDGATQYFDGTSSLANFSKNASAVSVVAVDRNDVTLATDRFPAFASSGSGNTRLTMGALSSLGKDGAGGRRLDGDGIQRTTGFALNTNWATNIGRWDWSTANLYHQRDAESETNASFQTAGVTSNTASTAVVVGGGAAGSGLLNGQISLVAWVSRKLTDTETSALVSSLAALKVAGAPSTQVLSWGSAALTGPYTLAPGLTNYALVTPNGAAPSAADLSSLRYHHHTRVAVHNGRVWVAYSAGGTNEDAPGQMSLVMTSADSGATWSSQIVTTPSQDTFSGTGWLIDGGRVSYPRSFVETGGALYIVDAIDTVHTINDVVGDALVAAKCNDDGTVGPLFRVSAAAYTPRSGFPTIDYDPVLGPPIFAQANLYGPWGGSTPGETASAWIGFMAQGGETFAEPTTVPMASATTLVRVWRKITTVYSGSAYLWSQMSTDGGATWTAAYQSSIPNVAATAGLRLPDGRVVLVGNPQNLTVNRDPLYLAIFDGTTGVLSSVYAVRQGLSGSGTYSSLGGAAYPGIASDGTNLWVSYSISKESIGVTKIPIAGL